MIDLQFLLLGWPSYLLYLSLFSLVLEEYLGSLVLNHWRDRAKARRFRRGQRAFGLLARAGLLSYGFILWFLGLAGREWMTSTAGLLLLTLTTLQGVLKRRYFFLCLLSLLLFLVYAFLLLQLTPVQSWF
jgi:hypothetical protein